MTSANPHNQTPAEEQELQQIFEDLAVAVFKAEPSTIDSLCDDAAKRVLALITRQKAQLLDELEKVVNRKWGEITTNDGQKAVLRDHLNHAIQAQRTTLHKEEK